MASFASTTLALSQTQLSAYLEKINVPTQPRQPNFQTLCQIQKVLSASNAASVEDWAGLRPAGRSSNLTWKKTPLLMEAPALSAGPGTPHQLGQHSHAPSKGEGALV